jgi:hypothetical protein
MSISWEKEEEKEQEQEAQANHKAVNDSRSKGQRGEFAPAIVSVKVKIAQPAVIG